jgi:phosphopantothenoylcysteine decarboxylase / phosphopantothenate---cysteine ligase
MLEGKRILLIVAGGIAAFKSLELVRKLRGRGASVRCVLTDAGARFVTPLSLQALTEDRVYGDMFSLTDESEMGHIQLSRDADLLVVAPATANLLARMAGGLADDLAATVLLATDKPVLAAPAMNVRMWTHAATVANVETLTARGVTFVGPNDGAMACNEYGPGRMSEPQEIVAAIEALLTRGSPASEKPPLGKSPVERPLAGKRAVVTSGPTREAIDPVRYISNHSSGKQGHAIAAALARLGAEVTLVSGPVSVADPADVRVVKIGSADEMLAACLAAGAVDVAVCAAAVADWKMARPASAKIKKKAGAPPPALELAPNPDILATLSRPGAARPALVVGFAAETENLIANAIDKRKRKGCDWIVANDVSPAMGTFGGERNTVHLISADGVEEWPTLAKEDVAIRLAARIADQLGRIRRATAAE